MSADNLTMGMIGTSNKENEFRIPVHPAHFSKIDASLRERIFVEKGYGQRFHVTDEVIESYTAGVKTRDQLFDECDIILLPKPTKDDFSSFREGQILWGWPHCVQGEEITQVGIDKKMTHIAWEAMFLWKEGTFQDLHIFHKNNELAGYCSVLHALQLTGLTGHYGAPKRVAVISFGSTARGAIHALSGVGFTDITVITQRPEAVVHSPIPSIRYSQLKRAAPDSPDALVKTTQGQMTSMAEELAQYDIIVNCVLQDTDRPFLFLTDKDIELLKPGSLIIDVSCDTKMGFDFARPTSFIEPTFMVGNQVTYYAVDHTPTYLWNASSYEISLAILPYIETVMGGKEAWQKNTTILKSIEIEDGVILNPKILRFQNRSESYPHLKK